MNDIIIKKITNLIDSKILINEPLKKHTTFGVGGNSSIFIYPKDNFLSLSATDMEIAELQKVSCEIEQNGVITTPAHVLHDIVRKLPENAFIDAS